METSNKMEKPHTICYTCETTRAFDKQEKMWNKLKEYADVSTRNYMEVLERENEIDADR